MEATNLVFSNLPLYVILIPLIGCCLILLVEEKRLGSYNLAICSNLAVLGFLIAMVPTVGRGERPGQELTWLFGPFGLQLEVGRIGLMMAILSGFLWFMVTLYSGAYLENSRKQKRYYAFLELTLAGCLGIYLTGNLFSLFIFFEILSIAPFVLVIYDESPEGFRAGYLYLALSIFGGLALLVGLIWLYSLTGTLYLSEVGEHLPQSTGTNGWIALLMIVGFGVKAGIVPLHIWLPQAHPVAPTPASALLSGVMIKAGAYGIFLTLGRIFFHQLELMETLGYLLIWVGLATMLIGAFSALRQLDVKRLLAYSSVSQMGYIILALGLAAYLGEHGALGFLGAFFHIFNHAFFKVGFFLNVGIVYQATHEKRLDRLGGLLRTMPVTAAMYLLFAGGIIGVPGFNSYGSKTLIHHTITEAIHLKHGPGLELLEYLFILTGGITFAYIVKMYSRIFLGKRPANLKMHSIAYQRMRGVTFPLAVFVILTGLIPGLLIRRLFQPMFAETGYEVEVVQEFFVHYSFWNLSDLLGVLPYVVIGTGLYWLENRYRLFSKMVPSWFGIEQFVGAVLWAGATVFHQMYTWVNARTEWIFLQIQRISKNAAERLVAFDRDPRTTKVGPISIVSLDFSKLWLAIVIVGFLLLSLLKAMNLD